MARYTVVVDYGKPYEFKVDSQKQLKRRLLKLKRQYEKESHKYPHFDIWVYDNKDRDITDKIFKKLKL